MLCRQGGPPDINLPNGSGVHQHCVADIERQIERVRRSCEDLAKQERVANEKVSERDSLRFKIRSFFSQPIEPRQSLERKARALSEERKKASVLLAELESKRTALFDYWPSYPPDWDSRRDEVEQRLGKRCTGCRRRVNGLHLHHIQFLSKGGSNRPDNLTLLCERCHSKAHDGRDLSGLFGKDTPRDPNRVPSNAELLQQAIAQGRTVVFEYRARGDRRYQQRSVRPAELFD